MVSGDHSSITNTPDASCTCTSCVCRGWPHWYMYLVCAGAGLTGNVCAGAGLTGTSCVCKGWPHWYMYLVCAGVGLTGTCTSCVCRGWPHWYTYLIFMQGLASLLVHVPMCVHRHFFFSYHNTIMSSGVWSPGL